MSQCRQPDSSCNGIQQQGKVTHYSGHHQLYISAVSSKTMKAGFDMYRCEPVYRHYFKVSLVNVKELPNPGEA